MDQIPHVPAPESATHKPGSSPDHAAGQGLAEGLIPDCLAETFTPGSRKPRHDGWTPQAIGIFLRTLAADGIVEHSARAAGMSGAAAYAFRNRRQGRAFARMWDAILIHRARARLAAENQARAIAGCVSRRVREGAPDTEYHYHDNRLSMAMLTRLDRLADKEAPNEDHLRALSEELEEFIDCAAQGGDLDAFVEERKPRSPAPPPPREPDPFPDLTMLASIVGCPNYRDVAPHDIDVLDLDPTRQDEWGSEHWIRAFRSGFLATLQMRQQGAPGFAFSPGDPVRFTMLRIALEAARAQDSSDPENPMEMARQGRKDEIDVADLDPAALPEWTGDQWARAWCSGFLADLPAMFWETIVVQHGPPAAGG